MIIFPLLVLLLALIAGLYLLGPSRSRPALATAGLIVTGVLLGLSPLELGIYGLLLGAFTVVALFASPASGPVRLVRVGSYLIGGGAGGLILLLSLIIRIGRVCGGYVVLPPGVNSFECYAPETFAGLAAYAAVLAVGAIMVLVSRSPERWAARDKVRASPNERHA
jgi:hypothetical protein